MSFDIYAKQWDTEARIIRAKDVAKAIDEALDCEATSHVLEVGCGTGLVSFNLLNRFRHFTMIDASKTMLDIVRSKMDHYNAKNMMVTHHMDLATERDYEETFDAVYSSMFLHHIMDTEAMIDQLKGLLKDQATLCIVDLDTEDGRFHHSHQDFLGHNGFDQGDLKALLEDKGFKEVKSHTFYHGKKIFEGAIIEYSLFIMTGIK